jgi:hypothetical protein
MFTCNFEVHEGVLHNWQVARALFSRAMPHKTLYQLKISELRLKSLIFTISTYICRAGCLKLTRQTHVYAQT